jgi:hypothetical protein
MIEDPNRPHSVERPPCPSGSLFLSAGWAADAHRELARTRPRDTIRRSIGSAAVNRLGEERHEKRRVGMSILRKAVASVVALLHPLVSRGVLLREAQKWQGTRFHTCSGSY